jgi:hypothetical protein
MWSRLPSRAPTSSSARHPGTRSSKLAYADLLKHGVIRGHDRLPAPILVDLNTLENSIRPDLGALALTVEAAAEIGVKLSRATVGRQIDLSRLTDEELKQLRRLVEKAEGHRAT